MARVVFTASLERFLACPPREVGGSTVREVLDAVFLENTRLRGYVLDERGQLRQHVVVFVDGRSVEDRERLGDRVGEASEVFVMQALSGG